MIEVTSFCFELADDKLLMIVNFCAYFSRTSKGLLGTMTSISLRLTRLIEEDHERWWQVQ